MDMKRLQPLQNSTALVVLLMRMMVCRFSIILCAGIALVLSHGAAAQEGQEQGGFIGYGIAPIIGGDIPGARQQALADAQKKSIIAAVSARVPVSVLIEQMPSLEQNLLQQPDQYLQRFKILQENSLMNQYRVVVQAFMNQELLQQRLAETGVVAAPKERLRLVLLIALRNQEQTEDTCWWTGHALTPAAAAVQQELAERFTNAGLDVVTADTLSVNVPPAPCGDLSPEDASRIGAALGATHILSGRAVLSALPDGNVQCTFRVRLVTVAAQSVVVEATASALGRHDSARGAEAAAVAAAGAQLAEQIQGALSEQNRNPPVYTFWLLFTKKATREEVRQCMDAFGAVLPGLKILDMKSDSGETVWNVNVISTAPNVDALRNLFGPGVPGYVSKIISARDQTITMQVTRIKKRVQSTE